MLLINGRKRVLFESLLSSSLRKAINKKRTLCRSGVARDTRWGGIELIPVRRNTARSAGVMDHRKGRVSSMAIMKL